MISRSYVLGSKLFIIILGMEFMRGMHRLIHCFMAQENDTVPFLVIEDETRRKLREKLNMTVLLPQSDEAWEYNPAASWQI